MWVTLDARRDVVSLDTGTAASQVIYVVELSDARFYELWLTRELTNPRVGVIPSLILD